MHHKTDYWGTTSHKPARVICSCLRVTKITFKLIIGTRTVSCLGYIADFDLTDI